MDCTFQFWRHPYTYMVGSPSQKAPYWSAMFYTATLYDSFSPNIESGIAYLDIVPLSLAKVPSAIRPLDGQGPLVFYALTQVVNLSAH